MSKDFLTEDSLLPNGQKWVCLSFLTPEKELEGKKQTTLSGLKIRGVFSSYDEACNHAKKLQSVDQAFNVFVGEMGKWLPFDPAPDSEYVKNSEYANEKLNEMMKKYHENQEKAKLLHEHNKNELIMKNLDSNLSQRRKNRQELMKEISSAEGLEKEKLVKDLSSLDEQIKAVEEKMEEASKVDQALKDKLGIKPNTLSV
jgi:DNA repair exonuclease SbcCD ATPase subunit